MAITNKALKKRYLEVLYNTRKIANGKDVEGYAFSHFRGICALVAINMPLTYGVPKDRIIGEALEHMKILCIRSCEYYEWVHYSNEPHYPISTKGIGISDEYPDSDDDSRDAFHFIDNKWDKNSEYCRRRYELLDLLIKFLESA